MRIATTVFASLAASGALAAAALGQQVPRTSATDKGSLIVFPKIELRWARDLTANAVDGGDCSPPGWRLVTDTFVDLSNDYPRDVDVQMYFVNGEVPDKGGYCQPGFPVPPHPDAEECDRDEECAEGFCERYHFGWNWVDVKIELTAHQPVYWSACSGSHLVSPFTILDPGDEPGRPCNDGTGLRCLRGFVIAFAVDSENAPIRWNHLKGDALVVHYDFASGPGAYSYNAYSFGALWGDDNPATTDDNIYPEFTPGDEEVSTVELILDGELYEACPAYLLYDFYAEDSNFIKYRRDIFARNALTLLPMDLDLRQENEGPTVTKATFTTWNENEVKFTGQHRCIECWEEEVIANYWAPNHLLKQNLGTNKGKAQIDGLASPEFCEKRCTLGDEDSCRKHEICEDDPRDSCDPTEGDSNCPGLCGGRISTRSAMLGIAEMDLVQAPPGRVVGKAAHNLVGVGTETCTIKVDITSRPPPEIATEPSDDASTSRTGSLVQPKLTPRGAR